MKLMFQTLLILLTLIGVSCDDDIRVNCPTSFFSETIKEQIILNSLGINDLVFNTTFLKRMFVKK